MMTADEVRARRRERVKELHSQGKTTGEILREIGGVVGRAVICSDYKSLRLKPHVRKGPKQNWKYPESA